MNGGYPPNPPKKILDISKYYILIPSVTIVKNTLLILNI